MGSNTNLMKKEQEIKDNGKNIRVSTSSWERIRKYCFLHNVKMGKFTEDAAIEKIKQSKQKSKAGGANV